MTTRQISCLGLGLDQNLRGNDTRCRFQFQSGHGDNKNKGCIEVENSRDTDQNDSTGKCEFPSRGP